jgi:hypothetical protein
MIFSERRGGQRWRPSGHDRFTTRGGGSSGGGLLKLSLFFAAAVGYSRWFFFIFNSLDILLTPRIHDFFRAQGGAAMADTIDLLRGGAAAAAAGFGSIFFYSPNILSIFIFNSLDILLTPRIHDFFRAQGGAVVADTIDLLRGGAAAAAAGYSRWVYIFFIHSTFF